MSYLGAPLASADQDWRSPPELLELVRRVSMAGVIGLDPATDDDNPCRAISYCTERQDGLSMPWAGAGLVYCNPPYGRALAAWARKFAQQGAAGVELITLTPARPDTAWWHDSMLTAARICFLRGRLRFSGCKDSAPFPSAVAYWGPRPLRFEAVFADHGWVVPAGRRDVAIERQQPSAGAGTAACTCSVSCKPGSVGPHAGYCAATPEEVGIAVNCTTCGMRKPPRGRSVAPEAANGMCSWECPGYAQNPQVGDLWPGETREQFGYPRAGTAAGGGGAR